MLEHHLSVSRAKSEMDVSVFFSVSKRIVY